MTEPAATAIDRFDPWFNRLAIMLDTIAKMSQVEREATLAFINAKFP